jgi:hypothetical protein
MRSRSMRVLFNIAGVVFAAGQLSASAPKHYFVSNAGLDTNTCLVGSPCITWQHVLSLAATGDEITALDSGDFGGINMTAGHAVTIDGGGVDAGVLTGTVTVNIADAETAVLRGLDLNSSGSAATSVGITFSGGGNLVIQDCEIQNYGKRGVSIQSGTIVSNVLISNTTVSGQTTNGIIVVPPAGKTNSIVLDRVRVVANGNAGVGVYAGAFVTIRDSVISNNGAWGVLTQGAAASVENTTVSNNLVGVEADNAGGVLRLSNSSVWNNGTGLAAASGGVISSFGNNQLHGNTIPGPSPTPITLQ